MKTKKIILVLLGSSLFLGAFVFFQSYRNKPSDRSVGILFTGQLQAKLKPCGCSLQDLGGVIRRIGRVRAMRQPDDLFVDFGGSLKDMNYSADSQKHDLLFLELLSEFEYDAINASSEELSYLDGEGVLAKLPLLNMQSRTESARASKDIVKANTKFWVTGIAANTNSEASFEELKKQLKQVPYNTLPIVLSTFSITENVSFLKNYTERPILLMGGDSVFSTYFSSQVGDSLYVTGGDRGRYVGRLTLKLFFKGNRLESLRDEGHLFLPVTSQDEDKSEQSIRVEKRISEWETLNGPIVE